MSDHDVTVRRSFERQTGLFTGDDAVFGPRMRSAVDWVEPLQPDWIVLDVACGAGHVAQELAPRVRQVVGVDLTPALLRLGAERLAAAGVANVLLQEGDAAALPFVDASFDLVVCRSALHHFAEPARQVAEMGRVCRPGGRVVVSDMVAPDGETPDARDRFDELHRRIDPSHARCLVDREIAALVEAGVGPVSRCAPSGALTLPLDRILTEVADRRAVVDTLRAELDGGPATGFAPATGPDGELLVTFSSVVVEASRLRPRDVLRSSSGVITDS
ncbi:MAG TPA: methyltransferase domain-containing protein [Acidimicrobiia bacterium]|nr:methyltransferase domain-containing protein [Acidimicrobiia bacterium]